MSDDVMFSVSDVQPTKTLDGKEEFGRVIACYWRNAASADRPGAPLRKICSVNAGVELDPKTATIIIVVKWQSGDDAYRGRLDDAGIFRGELSGTSGRKTVVSNQHFKCTPPPMVDQAAKLQKAQAVGAYCKAYANDADAALVKAIKLGCSFAQGAQAGASSIKGRWSNVWTDHYNWCLSVHGDPEQTRALADARGADLKACEKNKNLKITALKTLPNAAERKIESTGQPQAQPPASAGSAPSGFAGAWLAKTGDGTAYTITFAANGNQVTGTYSGADGSKGSILHGKVTGNQLAFSWKQADGQHGFGRFTLAADGKSFTGGYGFDDMPGKIIDSWNGTRQ